MNNKTDFSADWQDLWMKQSKVFFETTEKNLKAIFGDNNFADPQQHLKQVQEWAESLKQQWQPDQFSKEQNAYQEYWKWLGKMCSDATDMMMSEWMKRAQTDQPVKNNHDLYELWLKCCNDVYKKSMETNTYQQMYGDVMNATMKFWKNAMTHNR